MDKDAYGVNSEISPRMSIIHCEGGKSALTSSTLLRDNCFAAMSAGMSIGGGDGEFFEVASTFDDLWGWENENLC